MDGFAPGGARGDDGAFCSPPAAALARDLGVAAGDDGVPPGFGGVTSMWALNDATLVLGFTDATRVFRVATEASASASASFAEAESGLGFALDEPTAACARSGERVFSARTGGAGAQGGMVQVTAARAPVRTARWSPSVSAPATASSARRPWRRTAAPRCPSARRDGEGFGVDGTRDYHAAETLQLLPVSIVYSTSRRA